MFKMQYRHSYIFIIVLMFMVLTGCEKKTEYTTKTFFTSDAYFSVTLPKEYEIYAETAFKKAEESNSSASGYAADMAGTSLKEKGVNDFCINFGGHIYSRGRKGSGFFSAGIPNPIDPNRIVSAIKLKNFGISTYPAGGKVGKGDFASLSVITCNAEKAQLLAESYYNMDEDDINTVCRENNTPVLIVRKNGDTAKLCGWEKNELK